MKVWLVAAALAALGASTASAADLRLPPSHHQAHRTYVRHIAIRLACPIGQIDDRGVVLDPAALRLQPPPLGYCWFHRGGELHLQSLATGNIILSYNAF
jgi:hypothetical protein